MEEKQKFPPLMRCETPLDDKGRLRLPVAFVEYLRPETRLTVTVEEGGEVRLYPGEREGYPVEYGPDARVMIPRELGLERGEMYLIWWKRDYMVMVPAEEHRKRMAESMKDGEAQREALMKNGMR